MCSCMLALGCVCHSIAVAVYCVVHAWEGHTTYSLPGGTRCSLLSLWTPQSGPQPPLLVQLVRRFKTCKGGIYLRGACTAVRSSASLHDDFDLPVCGLCGPCPDGQLPQVHMHFITRRVNTMYVLRITATITPCTLVRTLPTQPCCHASDLSLSLNPYLSSAYILELCSVTDVKLD